MNFCGLVVHTRPGQAAAVAGRLTGTTGVEVFGVHPEGRVVATLEEADDERVADRIAGLQEIEGVLSAALVYHRYEDFEGDEL